MRKSWKHSMTVSLLVPRAAVVQTLLNELLPGDLSRFEVSYETLLLVEIQILVNIFKSGFLLERADALLDVELQEDASHIEYYCLDHIVNFYVIGCKFTIFRCIFANLRSFEAGSALVVKW